MLNIQQAEPASEPRSRAKSADRALQILEYLASVPEGTTFSDIAKSLALPKSSAHELLSVMTERSFVEFSAETKLYRLGIRTWELGQAVVTHRDLITEARPVLSAISASLDETVQISVLDGLEEIYLDRVDSSQPLRVQAIIGSRAPAHTTALGKVLLSEMRDAEVLASVRGRNLRAMTPNTITGPDELIDELRWVRAHGFAVDDEEYATGLRCVAVPIRDHTGAVIAAGSVAFPITRGNPERMTDALVTLWRGAADISRKLGCDPALLKLPAGMQRPELQRLIEEKMHGWGQLSAMAN